MRWDRERGKPASCALVWAQGMKMKIAQMKMSAVTMPVFCSGQKARVAGKQIESEKGEN